MSFYFLIKSSGVVETTRCSKCFLKNYDSSSFEEKCELLKNEMENDFFNDSSYKKEVNGATCDNDDFFAKANIFDSFLEWKDFDCGKIKVKERISDYRILFSSGNAIDYNILYVEEINFIDENDDEEFLEEVKNAKSCDEAYRMILNHSVEVEVIECYFGDFKKDYEEEND